MQRAAEIGRQLIADDTKLSFVALPVGPGLRAVLVIDHIQPGQGLSIRDQQQCADRAGTLVIIDRIHDFDP